MGLGVRNSSENSDEMLCVWSEIKEGYVWVKINSES